MRMMTNSLLLAGLFMIGCIGCGDENATLLYVKVLAREGLSKPVALAVTLTHGGQSEAARLLRGPGGGAISLPTSFVIQADGRSGGAQITVKALSKPVVAQKNVIGQAQGKASLTTDKRVDLTLVLQPSDNLIKTKISPSAIYGARPQVAGDGLGNHVVVWEDSSTSSGQTLYDVWFQLFNKQGATTYKGVFLMTKEHQPSVAMQQRGAARGNFEVVWIRQTGTVAGKGTIYGRSMDAKGQPDSTGSGGKPTALSNSAQSSWPFVTARYPSGYAVVWQEEDITGGQFRVMGRLLNNHGSPIVSPNGQNAPFMLASFPKSGSEAVPTATGDSLGGLMVVWNQGGKLKGSVFSKVSGSLKLIRGTFDLAKSATGKAATPHVAALKYGYGVIWSDTSNFPPDTNGRCIRFRRFSSAGVALAADYTLNTTFALDQFRPRFTGRMRDGSLLAVWTSRANLPGDPKGGINGRALLHNGQPVGPDFVINTSTAGPQQTPAIAPHASDGFAVVFTDGADAAPGLRTRLVFPDYVGLTGQIGALCEGQNQCSSATTLYCQSTQAGKRCLGDCKGGVEAACNNGGECFTNTKLNASYCTYPTE